MKSVRDARIEIYVFTLALVVSLLTVGMASGAGWRRILPIMAGNEASAKHISIRGPAYLARGQTITLDVKAPPHVQSATFSWSKEDPRKRIEIIGSAKGRTITVNGISVSQRSHDAHLVLTVRFQDGETVKVFHDVTVVDVSLGPDQGQKGVTGDDVPSTRDDPRTIEREGKKHYVSPRKQGTSVVLHAKLAPPDLDAAELLLWTGGEAVFSSPSKRRVARDKPESNRIGVKIRGTTASDEIVVWVVFAKMTPTRVTTTTLEKSIVDPYSGPAQSGQFVASQWRFVADILPRPLTARPSQADLPDLRGPAAVPVPEANKKHVTTGHLMSQSATRKWDVSRQMRIRVHSPHIATDSYDETVHGEIYEDIVHEDKVIIDYPVNEAEGNDDIGTGDEDNNPYSSTETQPGTTRKTPVGVLASSDLPIAPVWITSVSSAGDRLEWRFHFREFVRLQIGKKWFLVSDLKDGEWSHVAKARKSHEEWVDDGSYARTGNVGFNDPF